VGRVSALVVALIIGAFSVSAVAGSAGAAPDAPNPPAGASAVGLLSESVVPDTPADWETSRTTFGVRFSSNVDGWVTGVQFYRSS